MQMPDRNQEIRDGYQPYDKGAGLHSRDNYERRNDQRPALSIDKLTPVLTLGFVVFLEIVASVWWAATLESKVDHINEQVKSVTSDTYLRSQAEADKLNMQLQIDQLRSDDKRIEENIKELQNKVERLYDRVYSN